MRALCIGLAVLAITAVVARPVAATETPDSTPAHDGRLGILPQSWVEVLESNGISEQTALIAGGAVVAAIGVGVVAGASAGGATGGALFALWLAHIPVQIALMGGGGYLAWNYLWPPDPATEPAPSGT